MLGITDRKRRKTVQYDHMIARAKTGSRTAALAHSHDHSSLAAVTPLVCMNVRDSGDTRRVPRILPEIMPSYKKMLKSKHKHILLFF